MSSEDSVLEALQAEISGSLSVSGGNIFSILAGYARAGRMVYRVLKDPAFLTKWLSENRKYVGRYPYVEDEDVELYVGANSGDFYYKCVRKVRDKTQ